MSQPPNNPEPAKLIIPTMIQLPLDYAQLSFVSSHMTLGSQVVRCMIEDGRLPSGFPDCCPGHVLTYRTALESLRVLGAAEHDQFMARLIRLSRTAWPEATPIQL